MKRIPLIFLLVAACSSPEAARKRGGEPGADLGNRDAIVEIHEGAEPYHDTPCRMTDVECSEDSQEKTRSRTTRDSAN
ncbi:MAG TPA: hypothetical protein VGD27_02460 [Longimicrobiales bacterium]